MLSYCLSYEACFQYFSRTYSCCITITLYLLKHSPYAIPFISWGPSLFTSMQIKFRCHIENVQCCSICEQLIPLSIRSSRSFYVVPNDRFHFFLNPNDVPLCSIFFTHWSIDRHLVVSAVNTSKQIAEQLQS